MLDLGWAEMAIVAMVALVVIGPRDLPKALRSMGQIVAKARSTMRELQSSFDELARDAELEELKKTVDEATRLDPDREIERAFDIDDRPRLATLEPGAGDDAPKPGPADTAPADKVKRLW